MLLQEFKPDYFTIEERSPIVIATVTQPSLCEEDNIDHFGVELNQIIESSGSYWLVLDLQEVSLISSSAIGKLIGLHRHLHRNEGRLALCGIKGMIANILQAAKLMDYFHVAPNKESALGLLKQEMSTNPELTITETK